MTAALIWVVLKPFHRVRDSQGAAAPQERLHVYKAQIAEIDTDVERGVLTRLDAEALHAEVGRRLLAHVDEDQHEPDDPAASGRAVPGQGISLAVVAAVPTFALAVYLAIGSPLLPSIPHATRVQPDGDGVRLAELVRRVEQQLLTHPDDGKGWDVIAPVYVKTGRYADAANAYRIAARLLGETAPRVYGFAQAQVFADNGIVSEASRKAFLRGLALQPDQPTARFWLAVAKQQDGNLAAARKDLAGLLDVVEETSPFGQSIANRLKDIDVRLGSTNNPKVSAAGSGQTSADTAAMIEGMVSRLARRLESNEDDIDGWKRLIRSYVVLQRPADAVRAMSKAREVFASKPGHLDQLRLLATELKLET